MDTVLGKEYRSKGVIKYILATADQQLKKTVGFRVKTVAKEKPYYVKDTYYVINTLVGFRLQSPRLPRTQYVVSLIGTWVRFVLLLVRRR